MNRLRFVLPLLLVLSAPAQAYDPLGTTPPAAENTPSAPPPAGGLPFAAFLSEDEMRDLFDYFRDVFIAQMKGEEPPLLPPELTFKLEILKKRMHKEGNLAVQQLLRALQKEIDRSLREQRNPAPGLEPPPTLERTRS